MNNSFLNLVAIQVRELFREPEVLFWAVLFPVGLSGILGLAFSNQGIRESKIAIIENEYTKNSIIAQNLVSKQTDSLANTTFDFVSLKEPQAFLELKRGIVQLIIEPAKENKIIYHLDPGNKEAYVQYLSIEKQLSNSVTIASIVKPVVTQGSRYIDFLIPGMIALGLMNSCIWGIGWSLIELRIKKLLRRMVATPMNKPQFLLAQFITRFMLTLVENVLLLVFAYSIFDVQIQGSLWTVMFMLLAGNIAFGGIAILVAARPEKTQVGSGIINFITLSMTILSGIFFSYTNFPTWAATFIRYMPLTILADSLRSIFNEGAALSQVAGNAFILTSYGLICFIAGLKVFKWY